MKYLEYIKNIFIENPNPSSQDEIYFNCRLGLCLLLFMIFCTVFYISKKVIPEVIELLNMILDE